ncbi:hypothetical protein HHI36_017270 [Cryptolaemus montrouzieri]|uniref:TIR domain-containing protein n=1 Tax=Cryptolaemus montrouzieri TaxID=559131 RepID=A0ABD2NMR7_9CUCU
MQLCNTFILYLREHSTKVDIEDIRCNRTGKQVINLNREDYCASSHWNIKIILVIIVLSCLLIVASSIAFYHYYKEEVLIWLFSRGLLCCGGENIVDKDKVYDAFISFSHKDEDFIVDHLIPTLEGGEHKYKLCIHTRDFIPGELISTQIFNTVKKSRKTIVVLSSNFLDSIWGRMEFRTAHTEAMKEGRARVIILVYGDVNLNSLDDELKAYIKTNTYLKWGEPLFWTKLKYALHIKNRKIIGNSRSHSKRVQSINSQFDLKNKPNCSSVSKTTPYALESGDLEENNLI